MKQSPYDSVQKSELYALFMVLRDFKESLNIVTDSHYKERALLHVETTEFIPHDSELISFHYLFRFKIQGIGFVPYT